MATILSQDESLAQRDEILFPNTALIDTEPLYENFTSIQNLLRNDRQEEPLNRSMCKSIDGCVFNLIKIVETIGCNPCAPFIRSPLYDRKNKALIDLASHLGGAHGPLRCAPVNGEYFQRCEKTTQNSDDNRSNTHTHLPINTFNRMDEKYFQNDVLRMYGFDDVQTDSSVSSRRSSIATVDSIPDRQSIPVPSETTNDIKPKAQITIREYYPNKDIPSLMVNQSLSPSSEETIGDPDYEQFLANRSEVHNAPNPEIYQHSNTNMYQNPYPKIDQDPNAKLYQDLNSNIYPNHNTEIYQDHNANTYLNSNGKLYQDLNTSIYPNPNANIYHDSNPEVITKPNPNPVTYQQNISVRYLVPPTPPPPGPLIIREVRPPRAPTPPPLVIKQQGPPLPKLSPIILREIPPIPPPHQEAQIITKMLPPISPPAPRVIIERHPPLPPKPQSIIIEKWLPYKPPPPREVIYERLIETPMVSQFQPGATSTTTANHQRRHSAEFRSQSCSRQAIPVHIERQNSIGHLQTKNSIGFNQFARSTQQQLQAIQAHHQWIVNQHQKHMNIVRTLTTPALIVHHPPVTKTVTAYAQQEENFYAPAYMRIAYT